MEKVSMKNSSLWIVLYNEVLQAVNELQFP